jgi:hypothetical protein
MDGLLDRLANYLVPLFVTDADDMYAARFMAVRTIAAYQPETQADLINIGRTIAFSMSALAVLSRVASEDMPPSLQLRYFARANVLNRAADQSERSMERRRGYQKSGTPSSEAACVAADHGDVAAEPDLASDEAAIEAAVAEAIRDYTASRPSAAPPARTDASAEALSAAPVTPDGDGRRRMEGGKADAGQMSAQSPGPVGRPAWPPRATLTRGGGPMWEPALRPSGGQDREQWTVRPESVKLQPPDRTAELPR